jgi:flagellin-like hook-associated protein FlgL
MSGKNPFGDDEPVGSERVNPFVDDEGAHLDALGRIEHAARKIRRLRTQLGAEGLTLSATRELIDELAAALDATAKMLREVKKP